MPNRLAHEFPAGARASVTVRVEGPDVWLGLGMTDGPPMPMHWRSVSLTPEQARAIARALLRCADEAAGGVQ